jgi:hypothetical protein
MEEINEGNTEYGERLNNVRVIEIKRVKEDQIIIRLEATKRRRLWMRIRRLKFLTHACDPYVCPLYKECPTMSSPLKKYRNFGDFCNNMWNEYPELIRRLEKFGVRNINQIVPIKKE